MTARRLLPLLLAATALATPALAQEKARPLNVAALAQDDRRLSDLQRQVKELRAIVFQGRDTGQPVEVKPVGPDPQVVALQTKVDDLEQSLRQMTGDIAADGACAVDANLHRVLSQRPAPHVPDIVRPRVP